jgi:hypothetical protein
VPRRVYQHRRVYTSPANQDMIQELLITAVARAGTDTVHKVEVSYCKILK